MRKLLVAAAAAATALGGAMIAGSAPAQPYGYYAPAPAYVAPGYRYDEFGRPYYDDGYRPGYVAPLAGALIGPALANVYGRVPVDRYGPDPNGMIAPDGHRIKCKLRSRYDSYYRGYVTRRECR